MKLPLVPLLSLTFGLSSVFAGTVSFTFDTDLGEFFAGSNAGATPPVWSDFNGGSMMLEFLGGWNPDQASLDVVNSAFAGEFQSALINGGTVEFDITVRSEDIVGAFPGWFEPMLTGASGFDDTPFGPDDGFPAYYGAGAFPAGAVRTTTVTLPIEAAASKVDNDARLQINPNSFNPRLFFGMNSDNGGAFISGKYFVDNFSITSNAEPVVVPPPVVSLEPSFPGLNVYSSGTNQYDRQNLRTATPQYSWIGATPAQPVTYSLTISSYSDKPGMTTVFYLVPGDGLGVDQHFPDYGQPRCIAGYLSNNADGTANFRLAFKNDVANSNGVAPNDLYGNGDINNLWPDNPAYIPGDPKAPGTGIGGTLASVNGQSILGNWSIAFTSNTEVTITSPDGQTSSGALPNEATAQLFADPMYAYFGTVPNATERIGERIVFSNIAITGGTNEITADLETAIEPDPILGIPLLERSSPSPGGIIWIDPANSPFWCVWTLPATDYVLEQSKNLGTVNSWDMIPLTESLALPGRRRLLLNSEILADPNRNFFRMVKPDLNL